jgi:predicted transcriptional regulator
MSTTSAKAVVDVIETLEAAKVPKDKARIAAMSLAEYIAELQAKNTEKMAEEFKHFTTVFDERFNAINKQIDERFKVNEERIKTMFWKNALFLTVVILLANPTALTVISKALRLS